MTIATAAVTATDLGAQVTAAIAAHLHLPPEDIDPHRPLALYGLDSLASMELIAALEDATERALPDWMLVDHPTLAELIDALTRSHGHTPSRGRDPLSTDALIAFDATLPADVVVPRNVPVVTPPRTVLLTGATGLMGAHLLRTLVDDTRVHVLCLVRAEAGEGLGRVRRNLERFGLWRDDLAAHIEIVRGDLTAPRLGLDAAAWEGCADTVDAIYHAAADVDWVQPYVALRDANVGGTLELIRLAAATRPKTLHFVSSISVCYAQDLSRACDERTDALPLAPALPLGYAQTKAVGESLVRQAAARGLPVRIVRPALLAGDSRTGASSTDDLIARLIKGCIAMGAAPDLRWQFDAVPVDYAARAIVRLACAATGEAALHLINARARSWQECVLWMRLRGYACRLVPYDAWVDQLEREATDPAHPLAGLRAFFQRRGATASPAELLQHHRHARVSSAWTMALEDAHGLECPALAGGLLSRYFDDYVSRGFLPEAQVRSPEPAARPTFAWARPDVINAMLRNVSGDAAPRVVRVEALERGSRHSIISELTSWRTGAETGLFALRLHREHAAALDVMLKAKPRDDDAIEVAEALAAICGERLGEVVHEYREHLGLRGGHTREVDIYASADARLRGVMPECYGTLRDDANGCWAVLLERLDGLVLLNSADRPGAWTPAHIDAALVGLAEIQVPEKDAGSLFPDLAGKRLPASFSPLWVALAEQAGATEAQRRLAATPEAWQPALETAPQVLIHHDYNPRNLALRPEGEGFRLCAYDWELATIGAPQQDLAELLCFVLPPDVDRRVLDGWVERYRQIFSARNRVSLDAGDWRAGFDAALAHLRVDRFAFYALIDRVRPQSFLPRVISTCERLLVMRHMSH